METNIQNYIEIFYIYDIKLNKLEKIYDDSSHIFSGSSSILIDNEIYVVFWV